ncbi:hypothetical protein B0A53_05792 [Rhodotorula sp. CCFEE 5036]|nr:hypothetical protein B0A53_05792 [Rhodotorula sp. CCFEE 5036]
MAQPMLVPPCSTRAIPPAGERPVVVQCPYTLSSCPLFNPTFSTAEVLEAQAASKSTTTPDVEEASPAQSASSTKSPLPSYGLVESMRKAASPPASTGIELDDSSPFQYIDFSIAPTDAGTPDSASPWASNANFEGQAQSTKDSRAVASSSAFGMDPPLGLGQAQSPPLGGNTAMPRRDSVVGTAQTPRGLSSLVLDSFEPLNPALSADSYTFPPPPATSPTTHTLQDLGQQLPQPAFQQRQRQVSAGSRPGLNESPPVGLGPPDLRVAYELAGMAYKSRNPQSPSSYPAGLTLPPITDASIMPNSNGYSSSALPPPPFPPAVASLATPNDPRFGFPRAMSSYESQPDTSAGAASLPMTASTSADSNASNPAAAIAEAEGHKHVTPFISKLSHLLSDTSYSDVIRWNHDGTVILYAHTSPRLLEILGRFFRHTTVASFARQLNIYAFRRLGTSELLTQLEACRSLGVRGCASEWSGFTHEWMWREMAGRPPCDLAVLKPSGPKTEKGKQNLAKKMAENGGSKKRRKRGPAAAAAAAAEDATMRQS